MNAEPVIATAFGFVRVIVRTEVPFTPIGFGLKALAMLGCATTVNVPEAPAELPALVVLTTPVERLISRAGRRVNCAACGEEIMNEREVARGDELLCRACAGSAYYHMTAAAPAGLTFLSEARALAVVADEVVSG